MTDRLSDARAAGTVMIDAHVRRRLAGTSAGNLVGRSGRRLAGAALIALVAAGATGCGDDDPTSAATTTTAAATTTTATAATSTSTGSSDLCEARDDLRSSIEALADVDIVTNGTASVEAAVGSIKDELATVKDAASDDLSPQVSAFEDALDALAASVQDEATGGATAIVAAAGTVATTGATLLTGLEAAQCD